MHVKMTSLPALKCGKPRPPPATDSALSAQQHHQLQVLSYATHLCLQRAYTQISVAVPGNNRGCCRQVLLFVSVLACINEADSMGAIQPAMTVLYCLVQTAYYCAKKQEKPEEQLMCSHDAIAW